MRQDIHENARKLIAAAEVEGISPRERKWLHQHLAGCGRCSAEEDATATAIQTFRSVPVMVNPEVVRRTGIAVREHARLLQAQRSSAGVLWVGVAISTVSMLITSPYIWWTFAWLGRAVGVPDGVWQAGFLMWWFLPATAVAAAAAWRHAIKTNQEESWNAQLNRR